MKRVLLFHFYVIVFLMMTFSQANESIGNDEKESCKNAMNI